MKPSRSGRTRTPSSTAESSAAAGVGGTVLSGHSEKVCGGGGAEASAVVNDQLTGAMVLPAPSLAPRTVTVCRVAVASSAVGVAVTVLVWSS